jgi:uncharacterized protein YndB with AHSA1/START domain
MTDDSIALTTQVFRIWIRAGKEKIWAAITDPEWNGRYAYGAPGHFELTKGGSYQSFANQGMKDFGAANGFEVPDVIVEGEVLESDPPNRLVQTWHFLMDPATAAEPATTLTWEIEEAQMQPGVCKVTVTHELTDAPVTSRMVAGTEDGGAGGGWAWILSDLKTTIETDKSFAE